MYEHPIKRAGLTFNRILFNNTRVLQPAFPTKTQNTMKVHFKIRTYENGKEVQRNCK